MRVFSETLAGGAEELGVRLSSKQLEEFTAYYRLLVEGNKTVNLTAIVDEHEAAVKHFIDSLTCIRAVQIDSGMKLVDIGAGAGFPGIPLKICLPGLFVVLVEAQEKKVKFIARVISELGLKNIYAVHARAEEIGRDPEYRETADLVVARAVAGINMLAEYCLPVVRVGGAFLAMKGPGAGEEVARAKRAIGVMGGEVLKTVSLRLPFTGDERSLVVVKKVNKTPDKYPRRPGVPGKKPL